MTDNWTEEDVAARNREVFGLPAAPVETPAADVPESLIEAECTKILEEDGWRALRTDPVSDRGRGNGFGEVGMGDHLYIRYRGFRALRCRFDRLVASPWTQAQTEVAWIEFKRPGEKAKKHQRQWHERERARGALTLIAGEDFYASVAGFRVWYAASGLQRRKDL